MLSWLIAIAFVYTIIAFAVFGTIFSSTKTDIRFTFMTFCIGTTMAIFWPITIIAAITMLKLGKRSK